MKEVDNYNVIHWEIGGAAFRVLMIDCDIRGSENGRGNKLCTAGHVNRVEISRHGMVRYMN